MSGFPMSLNREISTDETTIKRLRLLRLPFTSFHEVWLYYDGNPEKRFCGAARVHMSQYGGGYMIATAWLAGLMLALIYPSELSE